MQDVKVGVGIIIENTDGHILIGQRIGGLSPFYSIPGGKLELGETFEEAAIRETLEETGLKIYNPKVIAVTNNLRTFQASQIHYVSINLYTNDFSGEPQVLEPTKCAFWKWIDPQDIPKPHFDASEFAINCYLQGRFYIKDQH